MIAMMPDQRSLALGWEMWRLGMEASAVIAIRTARLAMLDTQATREADRMVAEKIDAWTDLWWKIATGRLGTSRDALAAGAVRHYRGRVRRNLRRLSA